MRDLFGNEITIDQARALKKRKSPVPNGYAWRPGTGPEGETCGSCKHLVRRQYSGTFLKCALMRDQWTRGGATDIRARAPACKFWEGGDDVPDQA